MNKISIVVALCLVFQINICKGFQLREAFFKAFMKELKENHENFQGRRTLKTNKNSAVLGEPLLKMAQYQDQRNYEKLQSLTYDQVFTIFMKSLNSKERYESIKCLSYRVGVLDDRSICANALFFHEPLYCKTFNAWNKLYLLMNSSYRVKRISEPWALV